MYCCYTSFIAVLLAIAQYSERHIMRFYAMMLVAYTSVLFHFHLRFSRHCFKTKMFYCLDQLAIWPCGIVILWHGVPPIVYVIVTYVVLHFYIRSPITIQQHCFHVHLPVAAALMLQHHHLKQLHKLT